MSDLTDLLKRTAAYAQEDQPDGSKFINMKGMATDLIALMKSEGRDKELFLKLMDQLWDDVDVMVTQRNKDH